MKTEVMPKVSGGEGSWIQGSDAAMEVTAMGEQFTTSVSDTNGYSVWLYHSLPTPTTVKLEWGMNFEAWKIELYVSNIPGYNWKDVTGSTSVTVSIQPNTQYTAQVKALWEAQKIYSDPITFKSTFAITGCDFAVLPEGKGYVYASGNIPLLGYQYLYFRKESGSYIRSSVIADGSSCNVRFDVVNLEENVKYYYYVELRCVGNGVAQSATYCVVYNSPAITNIVWVPEYEKGKITWTTSVGTTNNYITYKEVDGTQQWSVTASGSGSTTHTAYITGLKPSGKYQFTVHSKYGGSELTGQKTGETRMYVSPYGSMDIFNGKEILYGIWWTSTKKPGYKPEVWYLTLGTRWQYVSVDLGNASYDGAKWRWYVFLSIPNPERNANIPVYWYVWMKYDIEGYGVGEIEQTSTQSDKCYKNSDTDKLFDCEEGYYGTNKYNPDTDYDAISDYDEVQGVVKRYVRDCGAKGYLFYLQPPPGGYSRIFSYHTNPLIADTDGDGKKDSADLVPLDYDMDGDGYLSSLWLILPKIYVPGWGLINNPYYLQRLASAVRNDRWLVKTDQGYIEDEDIDGDGIDNNADPDDEGDGMSDYYEWLYGIAYGGWQHLLIYNARYAILVGGGGVNPPSSTEDANIPAFWIDTYTMYNKLVEGCGYLPENVELLYCPWFVFTYVSTFYEDWAPNAKVRVDFGNWETIPVGESWKIGQTIEVSYDGGYLYYRDTNSYNGVIRLRFLRGWGGDLIVDRYGYYWQDYSNHNQAIAGEATYEDFCTSLSSIGKKITENDFITILFNQHGFNGGLEFRLIEKTIKDHYDIYKVIIEGSCIWWEDIESQIDSMISEYARMVIVVQACYSGSAITHLAGDKRVVVTSATENEVSWGELGTYDHWAFLWEGKHNWWDVHPGFIPNMGSIIQPFSVGWAFKKGFDAAQMNKIEAWGWIIIDGRSTPQISNIALADSTYW
ncbi:MAG: C13 family peptidase [Thermoplasmata archaeon]